MASVRSVTGPTDDFGTLLESARNGQPGALSELWARYAGRVAAFVRARGAREVDEITNDVFLAAFGALRDFTGDERGFRSLLFTVARRRVVDEQRRRTREALGSDWTRPTASSADDPESAAIGRESAEVMLDLVHQLTDDQRDVVLLRLVADLSIEEVAAALGRSPGSVKSLQRRGLDALRRRWPAEERPSAITRPAPRDRHDPEGPLP